MRRAALTALALLVTTSVAAAQLRPEDAPLAPNDTRCGTDCIRCAADGCVKCARLLVWPAGICSHSCPSGTRESWSHDDHLMGRICYPTHFHKEIIVGGAGGGVLCIILIAGVGAWYARRRRAQLRPHPVPQRQHLGDDDARLREFHKQLDCLRPHAYTLLAILNHTRHQVRELYQLGNNDAAMAYSCILSDLAKLLILLNKQQVPVVPDEWPRLASWAERTLKRFNRMNENQQQEEFQIINFLPSPKPDSEILHQSFTTFKPLSCSQTSCNSDEVDQERQTNDGRPPSYTQVERERNREAIVLSVPWERPQIVRRESIWLEDELFEMMRRPQDELTTEL